MLSSLGSYQEPLRSFLERENVMAKVKTGGVIYDNMEFPAYKFAEFPKWVMNSSGDSVLVADQREEIKVISELPEKDRPKSPTEIENEKLVKLLADMQAKLDKMPQAAVQLAAAGSIPEKVK